MNRPPRTRIRDRIFRAAAVCGIAAGVLSAYLALRQPRIFFPAYLTAVIWVWSLSLGSLVLGFLFHLTGGRWGEAGREWFEVGARAMPLVLLLFVPLVFGLHYIYPWTESDYFAAMDEVSHRQWYYTRNFFLLRSLVYFCIWISLGTLLGGLPGRPRTPRPLAGGQAAAGLAEVALLLTITWAAMDWLMSITPLFASSLYGALVGVGAMLSGMAFIVAGVTVTGASARAAPNDRGPSPPRQPSVDLANLLLAMVMLWAYLQFSQFLLIWSGNLPVEAKYYLVRSTSGWQILPVLVAIGGFMIPLALLMSATFKRSPRSLGCLAVWLIGIRLLELDWLTLPAFSPARFALTASDAIAPLAVGGIWLSFVVWDLPHSAWGPATGGDRIDV